MGDISGPEEEGTECPFDEDTCSQEDLLKSFRIKYKISDENAVTLKKDYILSLASDSSFTCLAAGLSNASVQIFDLASQQTLTPSTLSCFGSDAAEESISICGLRFLDESPNSLLVGTNNGLIRLYDLRTSQKEIILRDSQDNDGHVEKTFTCFDRNANGRIVCAGTEEVQNNVYILFFDLRERKQLGGYFESHQDDVTSLRFHDKNPDLLCSGSTDGLINVYNIQEEDEEEALLATINTDSSVHKLKWHKDVHDKDMISCITHTNDFKIYEAEEGDEVADISREKITATLKRRNEGNLNLIDAHNMGEDGKLFLLAGTNSNKGETMRSVMFESKKLVPLANFEGNKQIVRESLYDARSQLLVTAGESGIVSLWNPASLATDYADERPEVGKLKKRRDGKQRSNPY